MKYKKNYYGNREDYDDDEYAELRAGQKKRPIRNWKKVYSDHDTEADQIDDFYSNKRSYK